MRVRAPSPLIRSFGIRGYGIAALLILAACTSPYDGAWMLTWKLDPSFPLTSDTRVVHLLANEGNCSGNEDRTTKERLLPPLIDYRTDEILIRLYVVRHATQLLSCPDVPLEIELSEPVGTRWVLRP